jgi:hypothetical protein
MIVQILLAQTEGFIADAFDRHAFGKQADARQIHRMAGVQRRLQAGRIFRFHRDHFDLRHQLLDQHRHARRQTAAAHRDEYAVDVGILLQQLQRQGSLTGDDHRVIERRHPGKALLLRQLNRFASLRQSCSSTSPPKPRTASTLISAVATGITISALTPSRDAENATPWAWLPAEAVITPWDFCSAVRLDIIA